MKTLIVASSLVLVVQMVCAEPITFDAFKRLTPQQRNAMLADQNNPSFATLYRWYWRMCIGEKAWQFKEQERIVHENNYWGLVAFFNGYKGLNDYFILQDGRRRRLDKMPVAQQTAEDVHYLEMQQAAADLYIRAVPLIAALAPTPEARALDAEAGDLVDAWRHRRHTGNGKEPPPTRGTPSILEQEQQKAHDKYTKLNVPPSLASTDRHPDADNEMPVVTREDLTVMDRDVQMVLDKLAKLPKLTPEQMQAAIDALPEDGPQGLFVEPKSLRK